MTITFPTEKMKPEDLQSWQPAANLTQLSQFIDENKTLFALLDEAWAKFMATQPDTHLPVMSDSRYAQGVDVDSLAHFPVSQEEMIEFLKHFENERFHNDRPFGDNIHIHEQNWTIDGLNETNNANKPPKNTAPPPPKHDGKHY